MGSGADMDKVQQVLGANNRQVGGGHYKNNSKMEHWDIVVEHELDYFQAQILRYVMRWKKKAGLQDLQKAEHFIQKYIELVQSGKIPDPKVLSSQQVHEEAMRRQYSLVAPDPANMAKAFLASDV